MVLDSFTQVLPVCSMSGVPLDSEPRAVSVLQVRANGIVSWTTCDPLLPTCLSMVRVTLDKVAVSPLQISRLQEI